MQDNIVNLNKFRKARERQEKKRTAEVNSAKFGRSKQEKTQDSDAISRLSTHLDAHKTDE